MRIARLRTSLNDIKTTPRESGAAGGELRASSFTGAPETPQWIERARPRGIRRVPTHTVGVSNERRTYARANLRLALRVTRVAGQRQADPIRLSTRDISSSGVFFLCPQRLEPGTPVELEVALVDRPRRYGSVRMITEAHIVRTEPARVNGWHGLAAIFDDITFHRSDPLPPRFDTD
jgi:hypothetical protein